MYMALCDLIEVKGSKSMRVLRGQSSNGVLTPAAFISGHPSDGRYTVASRRRAGAIPRQDAGCAIALFVLFSVIDFECVQYCIGMFISSTGGIMLSFNLISHCSEPRSDRCICASSRSRCQLIVGPPKRLSQSGGRKSHR